ncbi:serpin family protein [Limnoglobus roseus]|nr:serpin family protein [Limnoglobus roseus]
MPLNAAESPVADLGSTTGVNPFAIDLYSQLKSQKGNVFVSPLSISCALGMTAAGAKGETLTQMTKTLRLPEPADRPEQHKRFARLVFALYGGPERKSRPYQLHVANAIYAQKGYPWRAEFKKVVGEYAAELNDVDFTAEAEKTRLAINKWAADQTKDKIQNLFAERTINSLTRLVIVNAIYYKGQWEKPFVKTATKDAPFQLADGTKLDVPMMFQKSRVRMHETEEVQLLELPYSGQQTSMLIFLPKANDGLADFEAKFTADSVAKSISELKPAGEVQIYLPKFKVSTEYTLNDTLKAMGMTDAFNFEKADFGGMVTSKPEGELAITTVVHKAYCDVNEEGTEAAAATGVAVGVRSVRDPSERKIFKADHPFLFAIRHNPTNTLLFTGRVSNPKA